MTNIDDDGAAVYRMFDEAGALLYVGSTLDPRKRIASHLGTGPGVPGAQEIRRRYHRHEVSFFRTLGEARAAESVAIRDEAPELNRHERKTYDRSMSDLGAAVRGLTAERGLGICEVAYRVDMDLRTLNKLLRTGGLNLGHLIRIAEVLGVRPHEIALRAEQDAA